MYRADDYASSERYFDEQWPLEEAACGDVFESMRIAVQENAVPATESARR